MKICLISNLYPPIARGGAEKIAKTVADGLKSSGHEIFVVSTKPWGGFKSLRTDVRDEDGIKVYRFFPANIFYYLNDWKHNSFWRAKWRFLDVFNCHSRCVMKNILKREKPDAVITHNLTGIGFLIPRLIRGLGIKHIHTLHDVQLSAPSGLIIKGQENNWQQKIFLRKWYEALCRRLFDSPDVVVSPSSWLMDFYTEKEFFKKSKKVVLPNPISLRPQPFDVAQQAQAINYSPSEARSAELKGLHLIYLGQIEEHKGILFLAGVLKKLDIDFMFHIAGDGSKMGDLKKIVGDDKRFIVHGRLEGDTLEKIFDDIDLTVVPSLCYENSPTVVYESLAAGVPVAVAKIGGAAELIKDGENGFTFEAGNAEDLIRVLARATANRDKLQKMRQIAKKTSEEFRAENYIKKLLAQLNF